MTPITILIVAAAALAVAYAVLTRIRSSRVKTPATSPERDKMFIAKLLKEDAVRALDVPAIEQTFRNLFFTSADKGEGLIRYYMDRHHCGRIDAMQHAIQAREREDKRYD
jgi:hypothetical protein